MNHPPLAGTDATDTHTYPVSFAEAHERGIPHRAVHMEVANHAEQYLVLERRDGRKELPGGHVDWLPQGSRAETYEEAALREIHEELNLPAHWRMTRQESADRLRQRLVPIIRFINQIPSLHGNNNEWVMAFSITWEASWGDPATFTPGEEGNRFPQWRSVPEITRLALEQPSAINAALRHFLARRGILVPLANTGPPPVP